MATASAHSFSATSITGRVAYGIAGGLVGGVMFGILMQMMGMMGGEMGVSQLVGSSSVAVGWLVHLFNSALFGAIFALLASRWASKVAPAIGLGMVYGVVWWVLGALLIMPAWLGMTEMIFQLNSTAWQSLMGHLLYGLLLGLVYTLLARRDSSGTSS